MKREHIEGGGRTEDKRTGKHRPIWMYLVSVILICGLFGMAATYSRYTSMVTGTGTAQIARFAVDSNVNENMIVAVPTAVGESSTTAFQISNMDTGGNVSEVELEYNLQIISAGEVPFTFSLVDTTTEAMKAKGTRVTLNPGTENPANGTIDSSTGTMPMGDQTIHSYDLVVTWPSSVNDAALAGSTNAVALKVSIYQTEPGLAG